MIPYEQSTCEGDSGGPLMKINMKSGHTEVIGIAFFGVKGCVSVPLHGYVKVSNYVPWIEKNLAEFIDPHISILCDQEFQTQWIIIIIISFIIIILIVMIGVTL